jgi:LuxR family transcriptional regulator, maltose regulon positive regulatory protein
MVEKSRTIQLAKTSRPRLFDALPRERLFALLDEETRHPAVWIAAPPGAGKTTLVAGWLKSRNRPAIWYQVDPGDADPASFFYYLREAERSRPGRPAKLRVLPLLTPELLGDVPGFSRRFFRELFSRLDAPAALVLDNFQDAGPDEGFHRIVRTAVENAPEGISVIVVSRMLPGDAFAALAANRAVSLVDWEPLKLTRDETSRIVRRHAATEAQVDELHARSGGWAAGLVLLAERLRRGVGSADLSATESLQEVFGYFAGQLFDRSDPDTRRMLMLLSYPPAIPDSIAAVLAGNDVASRLLDQLYRRHLFVDRRHGAEPTYQFHALFRAFLQHRAGVELSPDQQRAAATNAAVELEARGQFEDAMALRLSTQDWDAAEALILQTAALLIGQGRWRVIDDWIGALPAERVETSCWLLHWHGTALIGVDPPRARAVLERCHRAAREAGDRLCEVQAAAGMVEAYFLEYAVFTPLDRWIPVLEQLFELPDGAMTLDAALRAQSAMLIALTYRMPDHPRIDQCVARVDELLRTGADVNLRVTAATHLTLYGAFTGHLPVSRRAAALLVPLLSDPTVTVFRRVFAWAVINWYACNASDGALGDTAVASNLAIAREEGLHIAERFACILGFYHDMNQRRIESGRSRILRFEEIMDPSQPYEAASLVNMKAWFGVYVGDPAPALRHEPEAVDLYVKAGSIPHIFMALNGMVWAAAESGDHAAARRWIDEHRRESNRTNMEWTRWGPDAAEAIMALRERNLPVLDDCLGRIFARERGVMDQYCHHLSWCREWAATLAAAAIERGIEVPRAVAFVREFGLAPPDHSLECWPWPVRIHCLGPFSVQLDGEPLTFAAKTPKKLLALLKAIVAFGGRDVPERRLVDALWPEEDGDTAHRSYATALHRLRKLLGDNDLIRQREGRVSLDGARVWVDALAFDVLTADRALADSAQATRTIELYGGAFLPDEDDAPWAFSMREKLRARYLDLVRALARRLEQEGRHEDALELYQRGIETDELAETFHQGLMRCHHQVGRTAEALEAYRRMRELLARVHGVQPSAATEALYRTLASKPAR